MINNHSLSLPPFSSSPSHCVSVASLRSASSRSRSTHRTRPDLLSWLTVAAALDDRLAWERPFEDGFGVGDSLASEGLLHDGSDGVFGATKMGLDLPGPGRAALEQSSEGVEQQCQK